MKQALRRAACALLAEVLSLGLVPWASATVFSDISDANTAQNVEVLQMMGVIDGVGNNTFQPSGTLTRAQFCKMAVEVLGQGDRVIIYKNYTIFPDVKPSHWAAGYINLAVRSEEKIISGYSDGTFGPDRNISRQDFLCLIYNWAAQEDDVLSAPPVTTLFSLLTPASRAIPAKTGIFSPHVTTTISSMYSLD